jgi:hypothetical protein
MNENYQEFNSPKSNAFKIWHSNEETVVALNNEFCKVLKNLILSDFCENKALVAFAKQLVPTSNKTEGARRMPCHKESSDHNGCRNQSHKRLFADIEDYNEEDYCE